jgi:ADP-heptose:LPS heptosyltransferase
LDELKKYFSEKYSNLFSKNFFLGLSVGGELLNIHASNKIDKISLPRFLVSNFCRAFVDFGTNTADEFIYINKKRNHKIEFSQEQNKKIFGYEEAFNLFLKNLKITNNDNFDFANFGLNTNFLNFVKEIKKGKKIIAINPFTSDVLKDYSLKKFLFLRKKLLKNTHNKVILIGQTGHLVCPEYKFIQNENYLPFKQNKTLFFLFKYLKFVLPKKYKNFELKNIIVKYSGYSNLLPSRLDIIYEKNPHCFTFVIKLKDDASPYLIDIAYHNFKLNHKKMIPEILNLKERSILLSIINQFRKKDNLNILNFLNKNYILKNHIPEDFTTLNLVNRLNLKEFIYLINQLNLLITGDTAGLHFAKLGKINSIGLFLPNHYYKMRFPQSDYFPYQDIDPTLIDKNSIIAKKNNMKSIRLNNIETKINKILYNK